MASTTARCSGIGPVLIIIILVYYPIPILWSNSKQLTWLVLPAAWWLNLGPEIIGTVARESLAGEFHLPWAGCLRIGAIDLIPEATGVVPPTIVHLRAGFVKHLSHIWAEGSSPLPKRWTPAPAVWSHQLELWNVASCDWIEKDFIIKVPPWHLILDATSIVYPYGSTDVFQDESLYSVSIQPQASIYNRFWHLYFILPLVLEAALCCHCDELKMNLPPKLWHYAPVGCSGKKARGRVNSCGGHQVCFVMRGIILFKSPDVEIAQDAGSVYTMAGKEK